MILDVQVPTADPGELIIQYTPLLYAIARRYQTRLERRPSVDQDDLLQAGRISIYKCQQTYNPTGGATFGTYLFNHVRSAMSRTLGLRSDGSLPEEPISLDERIGEDGETSIVDLIPDTTPTAEERIEDQDGKQETADAVNAAIDRLKNDKQKTILRRVWLDGESKEDVAADLHMTTAVCQNIDLQARYKLRRDKELRQYAALQYPFMQVGARRFQTTMTSATEAAVLWRERRFDEKFGTGAFLSVTGRPDADLQDPDIVQTSILTGRLTRTEASA